MKRYKYLAFAALVARTLLLASGVLYAQVDTLHPHVIRTSAPVVASQPGPKGTWMKAEVIRADRNSITVREQDRPRFIHTFTYGPQIQPKMQDRADAGSTFNSGDQIKIQYVPGQTVALKIHGKPSKQ